MMLSASKSTFVELWYPPLVNVPVGAVNADADGADGVDGAEVGVPLDSVVYVVDVEVTVTYVTGSTVIVLVRVSVSKYVCSIPVATSDDAVITLVVEPFMLVNVTVTGTVIVLVAVCVFVDIIVTFCKCTPDGPTSSSLVAHHVGVTVTVTVSAAHVGYAEETGNEDEPASDLISAMSPALPAASRVCCNESALVTGAAVAAGAAAVDRSATPAALLFPAAAAAAASVVAPDFPPIVITIVDVMVDVVVRESPFAPVVVITVVCSSAAAVVAGVASVDGVVVAAGAGAGAAVVSTVSVKLVVVGAASGAAGVVSADVLELGSAAGDAGTAGPAGVVSTGNVDELSGVKSAAGRAGIDDSKLSFAYLFIRSLNSTSPIGSAEVNVAPATSSVGINLIILIFLFLSYYFK